MEEDSGLERTELWSQTRVLSISGFDLTYVHSFGHKLSSIRYGVGASIGRSHSEHINPARPGFDSP